MKYFYELTEVENEIIRLGELRKLLTVINNSSDVSDAEDMISAFSYVEGSLVDICENLNRKFGLLFQSIKNEN